MDKIAEIELKIKLVMQELNIDRMPTSKEVRHSSIKGLDNLISRNGGYRYWSDQLGIDSKSKVRKWDDFFIEKEIKQVIEILSINRMPTVKEARDIVGDSLVNAITKNGGFKFWAEKLNLEMKDSETKTGHQFEDLIESILKEKGIEVKKMTTLHPFDLLANGVVKIDVKTAKAYEYKGGRFHTIGLNKEYATCDFYVVVLLDESGELEKTLIVPSHHIRVKTLTIGAKSDFDKYINRWDLIITFSNVIYDYIDCSIN